MKRSASFYIGLFLIGMLPLAALNCQSDAQVTAEMVQGTYTVSDATGLPSFTYAGPTTFTISGVNFEDDVTTFEGAWSVTGAAELPRIVENDEQVEFPASGTVAIAVSEAGVLQSLEITSGTTMVSLSVSVFDAANGTLTFTYSGAEPKVADEATVTVTSSK